MTIAVNDNKQITVNNETFSFYQFRINADEYLPKVESLFRASTFARKDSETYVDYLTRLFYLLYYKKGYRTDASTRTNNHETAGAVVNRTTTRIARNQVAANEFAILNALGIDMVKHCAKTSRIVFKNSGNQYRMSNDHLDLVLKSLNDGVEYARDKKAIKFGVELEFVAEYNSNKIVEFNEAMRDLVGPERYSAPMCYSHNHGETWELGRDGSVRGRGKYGFELTSPILTYGDEDDMNELKNVMQLIETCLDGQVNNSCGTHVHMSFECNKISNDLKKHFANCYRASENSLFDRLVPLRRRANNNQYCRSVSEERISDRYRKLNLTHVKSTDKSMHLEFRQLDGTLDYDKLVSWIKLQKMFIEITMKNAKSNEQVELKLEDIMCDKDFTEKDVEEFMTMSKIAA